MKYHKPGISSNLTLLSFKSYNDSQNDEIKNFIVGELKDLELIEDKKNISNLFFKNNLNENIKFSKFNGNILLINFWATWCAPCKKEMPSLDALYQDSNFKNLVIFAVNIEQPNTQKTEKFFTDLNIIKLKI